MKGYNDYMDNISVDRALHEKIMQRVSQNPAPQRQNRVLIRYASLTACAVILLTGVWLLPGLWANNNIGLTSNGTEPNDPAPAPHELTFNPMPMEIAGGSRIMAPNFSHELTDEQFGAVFPTLGPTFTATASYWLQPTDIIWWTQPIDRVIDLIPPDPQITQAEVSAYDCGGRARIQLALGQIFDGYLLMERELRSSYVHGVKVVATIDNRYFDIDDELARMYYVRADFILDGVAYRVSYHDANQEAAKSRVTQLVNQLVSGGPADWSVVADPAVPELRDEVMPLEYARHDPDFGGYLPVNIPAGLSFEHARRSLNQQDNSLFVLWSGRQSTISWTARTPTEDDLRRIVSVDEREKYDMSLYSIPLFDSVPAHLWEYVHNPIFLAEDMTLDVVRARAFDVSRPGAGAPEWSIDFSVLYSEVLVSVHSRGATPEQIWDMLP